MLELWGCFFLIYGMYIPPAIAITLYKPQLLSIWLLSVCLATLPLIITSVIYVQVQYNLSATTTSYVFMASEQTVLLVLSVINVCLQWLVKMSMFVILAKWQHKYAHTVILDNNKSKETTTKTKENKNSARSNAINSTNSINNIKIHNKIDLEHEVVFWSTRFRTLPLSMTVGAAFGFVSVIASTSTQFDLALQLEKFGASHLSSYNFDICPQLPSLVHVALQSCLLSFAHVAWGAMTGQVIFALTEIGLVTYWNQYCFIVSQSETWSEWWKHSAWRQVHNYNNNNNNNTSATKAATASNSVAVTSVTVVTKENREESGDDTNMNITNHTVGTVTEESERRCDECVEDHRILEQEEMLSLELHDSDDINNSSDNKMQEVQNDCKEKNRINTCEGVNTHLFLSAEREEEQQGGRCYHKHREEQEEEELKEEEELEEQENETKVDHGTDNTEIHNEQVNDLHVSSVSDSVFVDDGTHKLIFAIMWLVLYFMLQLIFAILPIFYHRHGAFDVITMRESNRIGCVVTLPVELVLVTISYIGFVWLAREEEVHSKIE